MPWLLRDGEVLCSLEIASTRPERRRGLLGRTGIDGALLIERARSVHSFGMVFDLDVAFCDGELRVVRTTGLRRNRLTLPVLGARQVLEAESGSFAHWMLRRGDELEVRR